MSKHKTKTKMPWFAFYTADYITATVLLSLAERGIYVDLLRLFWEYGSLPDDMDKIRVKMLPTGERNHPRIHRWIRKVLEQCFERTDDGRWFNPGFGDHHQSVTETPKLVTESPKPVTESPKFVTESPTFVTNSHKSPESEGVLSNGINAPESQEQNRTKNKNTAKDKEQKEQLSSLSPTVALKANGKIHDTNHEVDGRDDDDNDPTPDPDRHGGSLHPTPDNGDTADTSPAVPAADTSPSTAPDAADEPDYAAYHSIDTIDEMFRLFDALHTTPVARLRTVTERMHRFLESGRPQEVLRESRTRASENGQIHFCSSLFNGHEHNTGQIDNLKYCLFGLYGQGHGPGKLEPSPVELTVVHWLWQQDGHQFPHPHEVQPHFRTAACYVDQFQNQMNCIDYHLDKAEDKIELHAAMCEMTEEQQRFNERQDEQLFSRKLR